MSDLVEKCRYAFHSSRKGYLGERIKDYEQQGVEAAIRTVLKEMKKSIKPIRGDSDKETMIEWSLKHDFINKFASENNIKLNEGSDEK